jgi:hypothetical protein
MEMNLSMPRHGAGVEVGLVTLLTFGTLNSNTL